MTPAAAPPGARRDIVFVHIPKTAGTSFRAGLTRAAGRRRVLLDYGPDQVTSPELREIWPDPARADRLRNHLPEAPHGLLLMGHFPARRYWNSFNPDSFVTFVREPVARVISEYNHKVTLEGHQGDLVSFVRRPELRNRLTRYIGEHWRRFGFIGLAEEYEASLAGLSAHLGLELAAERQNLGRYVPELAAGVDAATLGLIAELNAADVALYAAIRAHVAAGRPPQPPPGPPPRGVVRHLGGTRFAGWCVDREASRTWTVSVRLDGAELARLPADRHDPVLRERGLSRTGIGRFAFDAAPAAARLAGPGMLDFVVAEAGGLRLNGGPFPLGPPAG